MKQASPPALGILEVLDELVDERVGIIEYVKELPREPGGPDFFHYAARACRTRAFGAQSNFRNTGGASSDRWHAVAKAAGEAVERYCSALYDHDELPFFTRARAPSPCVEPAEWALFSPAQYSRPGFLFVPFEDDTPIRWAETWDPLTGETLYVPAAMVYVPYTYYMGSGEGPIVQPISTGLACHETPAKAAINAVCEVIERDAFTITWQARLSPPRLRLETLSPANRNLIERFEQTGAAVALFNITLDSGVPTILSVLSNELPSAAPLVFAAAADLDAQVAARKSLEELDHTRHYCQFMTSHRSRILWDPSHDNIVDQEDHLNFWCDHVNAPLADFVMQSAERMSFADIRNASTGDAKQDLKVLLGQVRQTGHRVLLADLTTEDVRELGLAVMRAVIPGYHPLFMGYHTRALGGRRLWEIPQKLGYPGISRARGDNPLPHPFP